MIHQRPDELVLTHGMPTGNALRPGHLRQVFAAPVTKRSSRHRLRTPRDFNSCCMDVPEKRAASSMNRFNHAAATRPQMGPAARTRNGTRRD